MIEEARRRLAELAPVVDEGERLRSVLEQLFAEDSSSATTAAIADEARSRLTELRPLLEESEVLRAALAALQSEAGDAAPAGHVPACKARILAIIDEHPGITVAEIADRYGMKRTVVASSVSRLKRGGEITRRSGGLHRPGPTGVNRSEYPE